jgi:hypothetical protein
LDDVRDFIGESLGPDRGELVGVLVPSGACESVGDGETDFLAATSNGVLDPFDCVGWVGPHPAVDDAWAATYTANPPVNASIPSPFATCTDGNDPGTPPGTNFPNSEVEPFVAVNPTNPANIIGVYQQDRWSNGGAHGLVAAASRDGGQTWPVHSWAHFSKCSGGTAANGGDIDRASDPWVTFSPNGQAYFMSLSASADLLTSAMLVAKSTDGGATWSEPATLIRETTAHHFNDKNSITADPTDSNYVYAVWDRSRLPSENASSSAAAHSFAFRGDIYLTRTTDGGQTWEPARAVFAPPGEPIHDRQPDCRPAGWNPRRHLRPHQRVRPSRVSEPVLRSGHRLR